MKKIYTLILAVSSLAATAQTNNDFPVTGSATIYDYSPRLYLKRSTNDGGFIQGIQTQLLDGTNNWFFGAVHEGKWTVGKGDYQNEKLTVLNNGNVGVGTDNPLAKLDVAVVGSTFTNNIKFGDATPAFLASGSSGIYISNNVGNQVFMVQHTGNVGIGTMTPNSKLAVNGNIRAHEIKVETANWPDYVFAKDYQLPTLQETEKHIKDKGHLPGIPSAAEVNANGIDVGAMNAKLLQKIEELTLHLIEQNNRNQKQDSIIEKQQNEINQLKNKLSIP